MFVLYCKAQSVSQETALRVGQNYWNIVYADKAQSGQAKTASKVSVISPKRRAPLYVIQMTDGWVLVSSEMAAVPILASSSTGVFPDFEDMPDGMQWLLSYYEKGNQFARDSMSDIRIINEDWEPLLNGTYQVPNDIRSPLPTSHILSRMALVKWNQSENNDNICTKPYNAQCPTWYTPSCGHTYVGCGAIAMAQVLWYWQWPWSAIIPRQFLNMTNINSYSNVPYLSTYDWEHIPPELHYYTNDYDVTLLTYFLRDCGYAIETKYRQDGSYASLDDIQDALEDVFHYKSVSLKKRWLYNYNNWVNLMKEEISAGRPVIYRGTDADDDDRGHAFVLYGYTSTNLFKINWGWGGIPNGEYALDVLHPEYTPYHFTSGQRALIGIEPDSPECQSGSVLYKNDVTDNIFEIHRAGVLQTSPQNGGITIHSNQSGCIYASGGIVITPPFTIENGANIHITVRDALCGQNQQMPANMSSYLIDRDNDVNPADNSLSSSSVEFKVFPNPARDYIEIRSNQTLTIISVINSNGSCVLQSTATVIPVYHLPSGLYIVRASTEDGQILQEKLIKQ